MLILTRKTGQAIVLGQEDREPIIITVLQDGRIGIVAPDEMTILREELSDDLN